ncbi:hypothetical protein [Pedobacter sp.]|uniref:hypothetical protein n=1 Tax=Pedobacter sp. TaxID=1411316 RepID=UPI003D7F1EA2
MKLFHFLGLFAYLNIIVYEADSTTVHKSTVLGGDSLVEYFVDDLLEIPKGITEDPEIPHEDYRLFKAGNHVHAATVILICFLFSRQLLPSSIDHPFYKAKSFCLPGYYSFLFRFKPF